jgi:hypothetical protein
MRYIFSIFFIVACFPEEFRAQISAGQAGTGNYYSIVVDDTTIAPFNGYADYNLDINADGVNDYTISACRCSGLGGGAPVNFITPLNNNQVCFGFVDSCFGGPGNTYISSAEMTHAFTYNEQIDALAAWQNTPVYLLWSPWGVITVAGQMYSFSCSSNVFNSDSLYLGVRTFVGSDTLYGWVQIKNISGPGFIVKDFATTIFNVGISEHDGSGENYFLYPNPAKEEIILDIRQKCRISIFNSLGKEVITADINPGKNPINIRELSRGGYFVKITTEQSVYLSKIIAD